MIPLILEPFACHEEGVQKPVDEPPPEFNPPIFDEEFGNWMDSNAMPLVSISEEETFSERIRRFRQEENKVSFQLGSVVPRNLANSSETVDFAEYVLTHSSSQKQDVFALTSGYLYLINGSKSYSKILDGAVPNTGEEILVLKTLETIMSSWTNVQPGQGKLLEETAYFNIEIDYAKLLDEIPESTTNKFHKTIYKLKKGVEWSGTPEEWPAAYLDLFKEFPDVPIIVQGGAKIGSTTANTPSGQRLSMNFKMGDKWAWHEMDVKNFFRNHQRNYGIAGHPLVAKLSGLSVNATAVDVIPVENDLDEGYTVVRRKDKILQDFVSLVSVTDPEYHPLALDLDQSYARLVVPLAPTSSVPQYLASLEQQTFATKLKISNPTRQTITFDNFNPAEMTITPLTSASAAEPIFEIRGLSFPAGDITHLRFVDLKANGNVAFSLAFDFLDFHAVPIRFFKLISKDPATGNVLHQPDMDSGKLDQVIAYANQILGRQTNVYIYPLEENGTILPDFVFNGDLGDPIRYRSNTRKGVEDIYAACLPTPMQAIKAFFVWDEEVGESFAVTHFPDYQSWGMILLDTLVVPAIRTLQSTPRTIPQLSKTVVHELGHWFSITFERIKYGFPACSHGEEHFTHVARTVNVEGCAGGDWRFYANLMLPGERSVFITSSQSDVYNRNAELIVT